jgi:hypothetical protein
MKPSIELAQLSETIDPLTPDGASNDGTSPCVSNGMAVLIILGPTFVFELQIFTQ